jgi:hypothetical protein
MAVGGGDFSNFPRHFLSPHRTKHIASKQKDCILRNEKKNTEFRTDVMETEHLFNLFLFHCLYLSSLTWLPNKLLLVFVHINQLLLRKGH